MAPALHLVAPASDTETSLTFVVSRTRLMEPGRPYVIAAVVDRDMALDYRFTGAEVYSRQEMESDPPLDEALRRWDGGDHEVFWRDRLAHDRVETAYRAAMVRSARRHPSGRA